MTENYIEIIYVIFILWVVYMTSEPPIEIVTTCWRVLVPYELASVKTVLLFGQDAVWLLSGGMRPSVAGAFLPQLAASPAGALEVLSIGIHSITDL
jgi:hypothetical protein